MAVDVIYSHFNGEHKPGDRVTVDEAEAKRMVHDGLVKYATIPAAKAAGDEPAKAATAK
jgi:hypothetical protein